jgi:hypothetical protein
MRFLIKLYAGSSELESITRYVSGDNNFADAAAEAAKALFGASAADNVAAFRLHADDSPAQKYFFYAEKE